MVSKCYDDEEHFYVLMILGNVCFDVCHINKLTRHIYVMLLGLPKIVQLL